MEYSHEFIMPNDDIPFKMFVFEGKDGNYVREKHWHRSVEIFALFEGELRFFLNEKEYPLKPGNSCWSIPMRFIPSNPQRPTGPLCFRYRLSRSKITIRRNVSSISPIVPDFRTRK